MLLLLSFPRRGQRREHLVGGEEVVVLRHGQTHQQEAAVGGAAVGLGKEAAADALHLGQIADAELAFLPYLTLLSRVTSRLSISHQPQLLVENRPNATENRPNATILCHFATILCHLATLLRHFVHDTKVDLRRIACDFLTIGNRMGRTNVRGNFLHFAFRGLTWRWTMDQI